MNFCAWCQREYEPHTSQASDPKQYCCPECQAEAEKAEAEAEEK